MNKVIQIGSFTVQSSIWPCLVSSLSVEMVISKASWRSLKMPYQLEIMVYNNYITESGSYVNYFVQ